MTDGGTDKGNDKETVVVPPQSLTWATFEQTDNGQAELRAGLEKIAKEAGGELVITNLPRTGLITHGTEMYQFVGIKKTIEWEMCTTAHTQCKSLPKLTPENVDNYKFTIHRDRERGVDKDGIEIYEKHIATKDYTSKQYSNYQNTASILNPNYSSPYSSTISKGNVYWGAMGTEFAMSNGNLIGTDTVVYDKQNKVMVDALDDGNGNYFYSYRPSKVYYIKATRKYISKMY